MLRKMLKGDISDIVNLEEKVLHTSLGFDFYEESFNNSLAYNYVLADNEFIGFISSVFDGEIAEILNLAIDPLFQGKGYGLELLGSFIEQIKKMNGKSIVLEVRNSNVRAISLYKKFRFETIRIRKNYYSNGEDALFMECKL